MRQLTKSQEAILKALWLDVIEENHDNIIVAKGKKFFSIHFNGDETTVYTVFRDGFDWAFLPSSKTGKTAKLILAYIAERV